MPSMIKVGMEKRASGGEGGEATVANAICPSFLRADRIRLIINTRIRNGGLVVPDCPKNDSGESGFYEIEHTADRALHITGADMEAFLTHAAHGMISLLGFKATDLAIEERQEFSLKAFDTETLLVEWLNELLYWAETRMLVFHHFDFLDTGEKELRVTLSGCTVSTLAMHIKAATYHDLRVTRSESGFQATVVFDV